MAINLDVLREIAKTQVKNKVETEEDLTIFLKIWWSQKYNLPDNHPLLMDRTLEELVIDYYKNEFMENPEKINEMTLAEQEAYEEKLKEEMGDAYKEEYDYLIPPDASQSDQASVKKSFPGVMIDDGEEEEEEDFAVLGSENE